MGEGKRHLTHAVIERDRVHVVRCIVDVVVAEAVRGCERTGERGDDQHGRTRPWRKSFRLVSRSPGLTRPRAHAVLALISPGRIRDTAGTVWSRRSKARDLALGLDPVVRVDPFLLCTEIPTRQDVSFQVRKRFTYSVGGLWSKAPGNLLERARRVADRSTSGRRGREKKQRLIEPRAYLRFAGCTAGGRRRWKPRRQLQGQSDTLPAR